MHAISRDRGQQTGQGVGQGTGTGNLGMKLEAANWRQGTWDRELGRKLGGTGGQKLGAANWKSDSRNENIIVP